MCARLEDFTYCCINTEGIWGRVIERNQEQKIISFQNAMPEKRG